MSVKNYYRFSLALPIVLPLLLILVDMIAARLDSGWDGRVGWFFRMMIYVGGVPYAATSGWALWWMRKKSAFQVEQITWLAPFLMLPALTVYMILLMIVQEWQDLDHSRHSPLLEVAFAAIGWSLVLAIWTVMVGYGYVFAVNFLRWVLGRFGWLYEDA